jgi:beta-lactamase regulating signal transducer with metallopeptidase domain
MTVDMPMLRGIALAGVFRPRVLVGASAREALTAAELDVAIAHELAHQRARDNLVRALMWCVPDFLGLMPAARRLETLWDAEAECLADARAVDGSEARAVCLASALVKVARLAPGPAHAYAPAWSTFHQAALLETRVRRLVTAPERACSQVRWLPLVCAALVSFAVAWFSGLPAQLHALTEILINS